MPQCQLAFLGLICLVVVGMTGCSESEPPSADKAAAGKDPNGDPAAGSNRAAKKFQELKKKKPDYEMGALRFLLSPKVNEGGGADMDSQFADSPPADSPPADSPPAQAAAAGVDQGSGEDAMPRRLIKPGHWTSTVQPMKSNYRDFVGRVTTTLLAVNMRPLVWKDTPFSLNFSRPVVLAKGRKKWVDGELLIPGELKNVRVNWQLQQRDSFTPIHQRTLPPMIQMPSNQYFLAVLAKEPGRYGYLQVADAIRAPWEDEWGEISQRQYQVLLIDATRPLPLPANVLAWTSLAMMVWDDVDPSRLTPDQQHALIDWLHWGGRLVVSGPSSLATLRGSFLDPYLPVTSTSTCTVTREALRTWNAYWTPAAKELSRQLQPAATPWSAIALKPHSEAVEVPGTAGLFYQRRIGRGSLLVSGISLSERDLVNWSGFDCFLNGALLRRPRRRFTEGPYGGVRVEWQDFPERRLDSHFTTSVRLFARDWGTEVFKISPVVPLSVQAGSRRGLSQAPMPTMNGDGALANPRRPGGMGSWDESSEISNAARFALREAAGVRVPAASFVVVCLVVYLAVLVPLNWMVFRALNHLEWAWIAAPIIALLGTVVVVRQAQLDIGFVRAQTELGVLELAGDYPRGHLSRYMALYTSLSTTYDLRFDDPWAVATPFPARLDDPTLRGQAPVAVTLARQQQTELHGVAISSATTRLVHSEQMVELEGALEWRKTSQGHPQVINRTGYDLDDCLVLRHLRDGKSVLSACWLGRLRSGQSAAVSFRPLPASGLAQSDQTIPYATERGRSALATNPTRLNIDPLLKLACRWDKADDSWYGARAEYRLVARIDQPLPGCQILPRASQIRGATLVIAHLAYGDLPAPQPDTNSRRDLASSERKERP